MTQAEKQKWEAVRIKGQVRYILIEGFLWRGILSGAIIASVPYTFGLATHAYTMPVWGLLMLFVTLSLLFGALFGTLFWHLQESNYQKQMTDEHSSDLKFMSEDEMNGIWKKINRRAYLRRLSSGVLLLVFIFGGLGILPRSSPYRNYYVWAGILIAWAFFILFFRFNFRGVKKDCLEFGAICPKCNQALSNGIAYPKNNRCPNCGYELFGKAGN